MKVICDHCGNEFRRNPAALKYKHHFCSKDCLGAFYAGKTHPKKEKIEITKTCVICGKDISYRGSAAIRCKECQKYYTNAVKRAERDKERENLNCAACGVDIRERNARAIYCFECARKRNIESCKRYNREHKEVRRRAQRKYYIKNKVEINRKAIIYNRERRRKLKHRKYYETYINKNREKVLERKRLWAKNNREKINKTRREWYHNNKEKCKEYSKKCRVRQREKREKEISIDKIAVKVVLNKEYGGVLGKDLVEKYGGKKCSVQNVKMI